MFLSMLRCLMCDPKLFQKVVSVVLVVPTCCVIVLRFRKSCLAGSKTSLPGTAGRCEFYTKRCRDGQRYSFTLYSLPSIHPNADKSEFQIISKANHEQLA